MSVTYDTTTGLRALLGTNLISDIDIGFLSLATDVSAALARCMQAGVIDSGSFMVTQHAGTPAMNVDVASNSGTGAIVKTTGGLLVFVPATGSATTVTVGANASGNPRVDRVVVSSAGSVSVVAGTATTGATLNNLSGAAAVPSNCILLADVLVANGAASITNSVIRDRRPWARGAYCRIVRTSNASASSDYAGTGSNLLALIDSTNLAPRLELTGVPVRVRLIGSMRNGTGTADTIGFTPMLDSVGIDGMRNVGADFQTTSASGLVRNMQATSATLMGLDFSWEFVPAAGSHIVAPAWAGAAASDTLRARSDQPLLWVVEEVVKQNTANNTTTTG